MDCPFSLYFVCFRNNSTNNILFRWNIDHHCQFDREPDEGVTINIIVDPIALGITMIIAGVIAYYYFSESKEEKEKDKNED